MFFLFCFLSVGARDNIIWLYQEEELEIEGRKHYKFDIIFIIMCPTLHTIIINKSLKFVHVNVKEYYKQNDKDKL